MLYLRRILGRSDRGYGVNLLSFVGREDEPSSRREEELQFGELLLTWLELTQLWPHPSLG